MDKPKTWKTREGAVILIKDMTDRHLLNTIRFLERRAEEERQAIIEAPIPFQGEMAQYYAEGDALRAALSSPEHFCPALEDLYEEALERGMDLE